MSKDISSVARGHKAAISNPHVSEETKEHSRQVLEELAESGELDSAESKNANVVRGHKANLANPHTSEESKDRSEKVLDELDA
ncbi:conidiation protein 6 [Gloeophyllum trabeum ATCC 11539]|uniref:Conidiation protein 6 n=1 Tax=Gloeophyllum trabeum (strain ATCC 11539 / FP-39264 / Madison 617) TaxID=670483 RepID=S7QI14_GLOTA|nr:conidiation protein 6 [Gloeophyllum trabeum ATCC 11539]EPQ58868.1 conidiation protein 6 [Gloeophyllum trabeum ATCC 11539]